MNVDDAALAVQVVAGHHVVVELHEALTAPGPALELHVVVDSETEVTSAWWDDDEGRRLMAVAVGRA